MIDVRHVPIKACTGSFAILPHRSHSAVSTAPMVRYDTTRETSRIAPWMRSRSSGF